MNITINIKIKNENILIHCYMGSSRSATIVILYLIDKYKMSLEKAIHYIKQKRRYYQYQY